MQLRNLGQYKEKLGQENIRHQKAHDAITIALVEYVNELCDLAPNSITQAFVDRYLRITSRHGFNFEWWYDFSGKYQKCLTMNLRTDCSPKLIAQHWKKSGDVEFDLVDLQKAWGTRMLLKVISEPSSRSCSIIFERKR